jgi:8-hydroxy-5-deazaflavin:NADPH oxidoreductase
MKIGVIGSGHMGGSLSVLLARAGHDIVISNSRGPDSLDDLTGERGEGRIEAGTVPQAMEHGEVVLVAVPYLAIDEVAAQGDWQGKIAVDVTNYYEQRDGAKTNPAPLGSSEVVAGKLAGARVVKAWNTIWYRRIETQARADGERLAVLYAGDDEEACRIVAGLIEDTGFAPVYSGTLGESRTTQEPGTPLYNVPIGENEARRRVAQQT